MALFRQKTRSRSRRLEARRRLPPPPLPAGNPWPELDRLGLLAATPLISGPIGGVISASARQGLLDALTRLEAAGVTFEQERLPLLPFLPKEYVPLRAGELAHALEEEPASFVGGGAHLAAATLERLQLLDR